MSELVRPADQISLNKVYEAQNLLPFVVVRYLIQVYKVTKRRF